MLKRSVRNYFVSLKYFFTPLGTMFLGMMIGFSVLVPGMISATSELIGGVKKLSESVQLDFGILFENMWQSVQALPWDNPEQAIGTLFSAQYLNKMLTQALETILGTDFETFQMQIAEQVSIYIVQIIVLIVLFLVTITVSIMGSDKSSEGSTPKKQQSASENHHLVALNRFPI